MELAKPEQTLLKRHVAYIMPLVFSTQAKVEKKTVDANVVHSMIEGYELNAVRSAVGKRQDQQKYIRQHLRATECMSLFSHGTANMESRIRTYYSRNQWDLTDVKKVYYHTN